LAPLTRLPDSEHWAGWACLRDAGRDAAPVWRLADGELHRADGRLWWLSGDWLQVPADLDLPWMDTARSLELPGNGVVHLREVLPAGDWRVRYRRGGEALRVPGRGRRDLKRLLNEQRVPGFARGRLPLLLRGEELVAVANLEFGAEGDGALRWTPVPGSTGLSS